VTIQSNWKSYNAEKCSYRLHYHTVPSPCTVNHIPCTYSCFLGHTTNLIVPVINHNTVLPCRIWLSSGWRSSASMLATSTASVSVVLGGFCERIKSASVTAFFLHTLCCYYWYKRVNTRENVVMIFSVKLDDSLHAQFFLAAEWILQIILFLVYLNLLNA
jgi:hypothetical protein